MNSAEERAEDGADVPVLTQVVEDDTAPRSPPVDEAALEALARGLERAVLEQLGPEIDRATAAALEGMRAELTASVTQLVREAVSASLAQALADPRRG